MDIIISNHKQYQHNINLKVEEDTEKLPGMYWTPKMHKKVIGARFIIASKFSSLKPLAQEITSIFRCVFSHVRAYNRVARFYSGLNHFWVIDNNFDVVNTMNRMSRKDNAKSVCTFDFSTLYTKIPHDKLIYVLNNIIYSVFNNTTRQYMSVIQSGTNWVTGKRSVKQLYDADKGKNVISYLINNSVFLVGNTLFRQIIGIPMGSDPAPFFANLFLSFYETQWIKSLKRADYGRARRVFNTFRFIDYLIIFNDQDDFLRPFSKIYPPELSLKKENEQNNSATFLDMSIHIDENRFVYSLYDKRNDFNFHIVRFSYKCSNLPSKIFYSTIGAETLRICKASSTYTAFLQFVKPFHRHGEHFDKFSLNEDQILSSLRT